MCADVHRGSICSVPACRPARAANSPNRVLTTTGGSTASPARRYGVSPGARTWTARLPSRLAGRNGAIRARKGGGVAGPGGEGAGGVGGAGSGLDEHVAIVADADRGADAVGDDELARADE